MQTQLNISGITKDHIYTCYMVTGTPTPNALMQAVRDAKVAIDFSDWNDLKVTSIGENDVVHKYHKKQN